MRRLVSAVARLLLTGIALLVATVHTQTTAVDPFAGPNPPASAHVCFMNAWFAVSLAQRFQFSQTAAQLSRTNWSLAILPSFFSARTTVQSLVLHSRPCDVLIGGLGSTPTIAMSPLVDPAVTSWVDGGATSLELTNVENHPAFNRVIPTDAIGGRAAASLAYNLGWRVVSVMCVNIAYGRSLSEAFSSAFTALGGEIDVTRCFEDGATDEEFDEALDQILALRRSKIMFLGASSTSNLVRRGVANHTLLLMADSCTELPGAVCATYEPLADREGPWQTAFQTRNVAEDVDAFGRTLEDVQSNSASTTVYKYFGIDAINHAMHAYYTYHTANKTEYPTIATWVRSINTDGLTGTVNLDVNGDRLSASMVMLSAQPSPVTGELTMVRVATLDNGNMTLRDFTPTPDRPARFFWPKIGYSDVPMSATDPPAEEEEGLSTTLVIVIIVAAVVLIAIAVLAIVALRGSAQADLLANAPLDESRPFAVLFVGLSNEAELNDACTPESIEAAARRMATIVRTAIKETRCFEAQRVNRGTFMIVAKTTERAIACAEKIAVDVNVGTNWKVDLKLQVRQANERDTMRHDGTASHTSSVAKRRSRNASVAQPTSSANRRSNDGSGKQPTSRRQTLAAARTKSQTRLDRKSDSDRLSVRSNTSGRSSLGNTNLVPLRVKVGVCTGFGIVDHDKEHSQVSYRGDVVTSAAAAADFAVSGMVVVTERIVDMVTEDNIDVAGTFELLTGGVGRRASAPGRVDTNSKDRASKRSGGDGVGMYAYWIMDYGIADELLENLEVRKSTVQEGAGDTGAIANALTKAATGVESRRAAIVAVYLPILANVNGGNVLDRSSLLTADMRAIVETAAETKCHVHDVVGSTVIVSANVVGPLVSTPVLRATTFARNIMETLGADVGHGNDLVRPCAGVASGSIVSGSLSDRIVATTDLQLHAMAASAAASDLGLPCVAVATPANDHDLSSRFALMTVDIARLPQSAALRDVRLKAVVDEIDADDDGEWLYRFKTGEGATHDDASGVEGRWTRRLEGRADDGPVPAEKSPSAPVALDAPTDDMPKFETDFDFVNFVSLKRLSAAAAAGPDYPTQRVVQLIGLRGEQMIRRNELLQ